MIERFLPFPSNCQEAAAARGFSIFADIFFIEHICLCSEDAYSHFPPSTAGRAAAERRALEHPQVAAPRPAGGGGGCVLMSLPG